jgi:hypothetical protein
MFLIFGASLEAQYLNLDNISPEILNAEGPLNLNDVELFVKFAKSAAKLLKDRAGGDVDKLMDELSLTFARDNRITLTRLRYISEKIPYVIFAMTIEDLEEPPQAYLKSSEAEKQLLTDHADRIIAALEQ